MIETLECNKKIVRLQKAHAHDVYFNMFSLKASKQASVILYKKWSCSRRAEVCQPWQPGQSQPSFGTLSARSNPTQERWYHRILQSKLTQAIISSSLSSLLHGQCADKPVIPICWSLVTVSLCKARNYNYTVCKKHCILVSYNDTISNLIVRV